MKPNRHNADTVIVVDFETSGLSPNMGDRVIEVGAVKLEAGKIVARFQSLMNPGMRIDDFIERYTGITNSMLKTSPTCETVIHDFIDFVGDNNLVAHNASFDSRFLDAECRFINREYSGGWVCSMLASRRVYPASPNHQLGTLVRYKNLPNDGTFHRALADAEMTAHLWLGMLSDIQAEHKVSDLTFRSMAELTRISKSATPRFFSKMKVL